MTKAAKPVAALEAASKPVLPPTLSPAPPPRSEASKEGSPDKPVGKNEWVNALSEKAWVLQLAAMPTKSEIIELKAKNPAFEGAQVLLTRNPQSNKPYFILVRGPFASKEEAQSVMQSNAVLEKAWLRSAKSLKTQFQTH
jgi:septal ring-binding cell division protein DamX